MLQALIFDIDGTLVDTNELHVAAWREVVLRFGRHVEPEALRKQMGKGGDQLMPVFWFKDELARFGGDSGRFRGGLQLVLAFLQRFQVGLLPG